MPSSEQSWFSVAIAALEYAGLLPILALLTACMVSGSATPPTTPTTRTVMTGGGKRGREEREEEEGSD